MDILRLDLKHSVHVAVDSLTAGVLHDHGHGGAFVQNPEFALWRLLVGWIGKDATVQKRAVGVGNHGTNVPCGIRFASFLGVLEGFKVRLGLVGPVHGIAFVDAVDRSFLGDAHVGVGEDEFAQCVVLER